ncbi:S66 family peptidase [Macrococcus equipercicus]|uniref:LD-carboxypeptidase n=1 Tax=Macrococcus equipercicus TaxID=69967 RepID=A0A9Q9F254_9STAP|nr:S66 peptidase family protein [Macrococcus equipercicus]KAA1040330.1 LD-carboxypeptidase [Macrococcus equipercicus]UTH14788.1 LD-carboxypeptidase [Macrococcus equipercicus]
MIKPQKLKRGDTVAIVSLSSGMAGEDAFLWRTEQGIKRLEEVFGLQVKVMPHALKGTDYIYHHPEKRAEDLHNALKDPAVKAIICAIGGNESIRLLPYIDFETIKTNPKIFTGYSDSTIGHLMFYLSGVSSSYGPALLTDFAENIAMDDYTVASIHQTWFSSKVIGEIMTSSTVREVGLKWTPENQFTARRQLPNNSYEVISGQGIVQGHLIGGCIESLSDLRGTSLFPELHHFEGAILFLETSEEYISAETLESYLRTFAVMGIMDKVNGIIVGRPQNGVFYEAYKEVYQLIMKECQCDHKPILYNASFGHNEPKFILPYGLQAEINAYEKNFTILENAVID